MQLFPCPFCGPRPETEFHYNGEAGNIRPDGAQVSAECWAGYLYERSNPKGAAREIWVHATCQEFFVMERDTVTHQLAATQTPGFAEHAE
ncbi:sarcosine oxidase subunit delta [Mesorhizobium loti]|nr:sarcosine oxidase subunit delta [Mesorhizobium loti]PLP60159.1 sarcosine oxidase subunit delta [Mesorhizobium loti]